MNAKAMTAWRINLGLDKQTAAGRLGMSKNTIAAYEDGQRIPLYVALACAALAHGLPPIPDKIETNKKPGRLLLPG